MITHLLLENHVNFGSCSYEKNPGQLGKVSKSTLVSQESESTPGQPALYNHRQIFERYIEQNSLGVELTIL